MAVVRRLDSHVNRRLLLGFLPSGQPIVRYLCQHEMDLNEADEWGATALHLIVARAHHANCMLMQTLYDAGVRQKPPEEPARDADGDVIPKFVPAFGPPEDWPPKNSILDVDAPDAHGIMPLHYAAGATNDALARLSTCVIESLWALQVRGCRRYSLSLWLLPVSRCSSCSSDVVVVVFTTVPTLHDHDVPYLACHRRVRLAVAAVARQSRRRPYQAG
jgi:hypothetical protein